jgi:hypothetical protein
MLVTLYLSNGQEKNRKEKHKQRLVVSKYLEPCISTKSPSYLPRYQNAIPKYMCHAFACKSYFFLLCNSKLMRK